MYEIFLYLLAQKGVTTADVSKATGINQSTFANWKKRRNCLSAKNARLVADYFGVSVDYLMTGKDWEWEAATPAEIEFFERDAATPYPVTDQERELLRRFVLLDQNDRDKLSAYLDGLLAAEKYDKKELFA